MSAVDWDEVYGNHGTSGHVPGLLRALAGPSPAPRAYTELFDHLYHQGTRWQAAAVVVPFLVALVDDPATPNRASLLGMLTAVAVGDHRLPFDVDAAYPEADNITDEQVRLLNLWLVSGIPEDPAEDFYWDRSGPDRWARDAYLAVTAHAATVAGWVGDGDPDVAALAAALLAWCPPTLAGVGALLAVRDGPARASANLALAHLPVGALAGLPVGAVAHLPVGARAHLPVDAPVRLPVGALARLPVDDQAVDRRLQELLAAPDAQVALTAAIAMAYRHGEATPEPALTMLATAADHDRPLPPDVPGWHDRALRGFVALALSRIGW